MQYNIFAFNASEQFAWGWWPTLEGTWETGLSLESIAQEKALNHPQTMKAEVNIQTALL